MSQLPCRCPSSLTKGSINGGVQNSEVNYDMHQGVQNHCNNCRHQQQPPAPMVMAPLFHTTNYAVNVYNFEFPEPGNYSINCDNMSQVTRTGSQPSAYPRSQTQNFTQPSAEVCEVHAGQIITQRSISQETSQANIGVQKKSKASKEAPKNEHEETTTRYCQIF